MTVALIDKQYTINFNNILSERSDRFHEFTLHSTKKYTCTNQPLLTSFLSAVVLLYNNYSSSLLFSIFTVGITLFLGKRTILKTFSTYTFYTFSTLNWLPSISIGVEKYNGTLMEVLELNEYQLHCYIAPIVFELRIDLKPSTGLQYFQMFMSLEPKLQAPTLVYP